MPLAADVEIIARGPVRLRWHAGPPPPLDAVQHRAVDDIWVHGRARLGEALYDAPILIYQDHEIAGDLTTLHGVYQPYRYYYAQCRSEGLNCGVEPIGVSGLMVLCDSGTRAVVLGRRGTTVAQYPGRWECVPSGGVDDAYACPDGTVDFAAMLLHEFEEETCLPAEHVRRVTPFAVIYDRVARTYDICCGLEVGTGRDELLGAMRHSDEYTEVRWVAQQELDDCLRQLGSQLIPLSKAILELYHETDRPT
ncbi:MAG: NUDIX domain-containing protein [Planctomycetota bacterium]